ncbi:unnamed protein product, partial [Choristocarpus tenellus]
MTGGGTGGVSFGTTPLPVGGSGVKGSRGAKHESWGGGGEKGGRGADHSPVRKGSLSRQDSIASSAAAPTPSPAVADTLTGPTSGSLGGPSLFTTKASVGKPASLLGSDDNRAQAKKPAATPTPAKAVAKSEVGVKSTVGKAPAGYPPMSAAAPKVALQGSVETGQKLKASVAPAKAASASTPVGYPPMPKSAPSATTFGVSAPALALGTSAAASAKSASGSTFSESKMTSTTSTPVPARPSIFGSSSSFGGGLFAVTTSATVTTTPVTTTVSAPTAATSAGAGVTSTPSVFGTGNLLGSLPSAVAPAPAVTGFSGFGGVAPGTLAPSPTGLFGAGAGTGVGGMGLGGGAGTDVAEIRRQAVEIYQKYNPTKLADVDKLLAKYKGKEADMLRKLQIKYTGGTTAAAPATSAAAPNLSSVTTPTKSLFGASTTLTPTTTVAPGPSPFGAGAGFRVNSTPSPFGGGAGQATPSPFGKWRTSCSSTLCSSAFPLLSPPFPCPSFPPQNTASGFGQPAPGGVSVAAPAPSIFAAAKPVFGAPGGAHNPFGQPSTTPGASFGGAAPVGGQVGSGGGGDPAVLRAWMVEVFKTYKPENVPKVEQLLIKYRGSEGKMIQQMCTKYNIPPPNGWAPGGVGAGGAFGVQAAAPTPAASPFGQAPSGFGQPSSFGSPSPAAAAGSFGPPSSTPMGTGFMVQSSPSVGFGAATPTPSATAGSGFGATSFGAVSAPSPAFGVASSGFGAPSALGGSV